MEVEINEKVNDMKTKRLLHDINILAENKIPLDTKGNLPDSLLFQIDDVNHLNLLLTAMEKNKAYKGNLAINSTKFDDNFGLKISNIIKNNSLTALTIWNRNHPFSDRVSMIIGEALENNTSLKSFVCFLDVDELSPIRLVKFLTNENSDLKSFGYLKLTKKLCETITEYLNNKSKLSVLNFYYVPFKEINLLYEKEVPDDVVSNFADKIENDSNIIDVNVLPLDEKYEKDINEKLTKDIDIFSQTLKYSCAIVNKEKKSVIRTEEIFTKQNKYIDKILETIDRDEGKREKNSIVSIRSYLDRAIGESLNQALYDLEVQRERFPDKKELFTAKGSIRYVAQYLLNNKQ